MNTDLRDLDQKQLDVILAFTKKLVERQNDSLADFDATDIDLEGAQKQAEKFLERRKAGYRNSEFEGDAEIQKSVRDFLSKRNLIKKEAEKDTQYSSTTKPEY